MALPKNHCHDCGKLCRGLRCNRCHRAQFTPRIRPCEGCGRDCLGRLCQECWRNRGLEYERGACEVCGMDLGTHARCRSCDILAGAGHYVPALLPSGQCPSCAAWAQKQRRWAA